MRLSSSSLLALAFASAVTPAFPAGSSEVGISGQGMSMNRFCGTKPMAIALADGYGGNTWRRTALAEMQDELGHCKNVTRFTYANANGDAKKAAADIHALVQQGVNVLVVFPDFAATQLPAMRAAVKAGVTVIPYLAKVDGTPGKDFTANVYEDTFLTGYAWAHWYGRNLRQGSLAFLGGTEGAGSSQGFFEGFRSGLSRFPGLKLVENGFVVTNWSAADAEKATEKLIAKYKKIDGVATDFGVTALAAVRAFERAGLPVPAVATMASNNELSCKYLAARRSGKGFAYYSLDGTTSIVRFAIRRAVSEYQAIANPEPLAVIPFLYADSVSRINPRCMEGAPGDADLSSSLSRDKLQALFKQP